jgi:hypothetical protein
MSKRLTVVIAASVGTLTLPVVMSGQNQPWNNSGLAQSPNAPQASGPAAPAPRRDISGIWDAGGAGIGARGYQTSPLTPWGDALGKTHKAGDGSRMAPIEEINDPLSTMGDPEGFPRNLLFELRPFQVVQTPNQVLFLYMFEKRWRVAWTDGRQLPKDPDPRWYGYSVGKWEDDYTFVVNSNGTDERTWLDNAGNPHSNELRVEERYHRVNMNTLELTVVLDDPKAYTRPWTARNKLALRLMPPDTDLMEMIPSATEAAEYKKVFARPAK